MQNSSQKILLAEDDNNLREIYAARMEAEGFNVITATNGEEALAIAKQERPELIISDVMMPKISGFEMLDILRNSDDLKNTKVIMLTALGQNDDQKRAASLGANKYLVKSQVTLDDIVIAAHDLVDDPNAAPAAPAPTASSIISTSEEATSPAVGMPVASETAQVATVSPLEAFINEQTTIPAPAPVLATPPVVPAAEPNTVSSIPTATPVPEPVQQPSVVPTTAPQVFSTTPSLASSPTQPANVADESESSTEQNPETAPMNSSPMKVIQPLPTTPVSAPPDTSPSTIDSTVSVDSTPHTNVISPIDPNASQAVHPTEQGQGSDIKVEAETSQQEKTEIEDKIEDFVKGATSEATPVSPTLNITPSSVPAAPPVTPTVSAPTVVTPQSPTPTSVVDPNSVSI